ncbi:hypothetical protein ACFVT5_41435 [Streptomyces sp. NPDC058001]|uniref:hypothetical protein n=1 Tax=Streptomyces sp. NPDC058001 TaxID=3346300 RepID=UPI0036F021FF
MADDQLMWTSVLDSPCLGKVDPWRLDECTECELDGCCAMHECYNDDSSTVLHMDWFRDFASPDEVECGSVGGPVNLVPSQYAPRPCQLPTGHNGKHRARTGWSWPLKTRRVA